MKSIVASWRIQSLKLCTFFLISALSFFSIDVVAQESQTLPTAELDDEVLVIFSSYQNPFPDTNLESLEGGSAAELWRRSVVNGAENGNFEGLRLVNRAEALKMILLAKYGEITDFRSSNFFTDVPSGAWYERYVLKGLELFIVNGYGDGTFGPADPVTTSQFLKMIVKTFELEENLSYLYEDVSSSDWFAPYSGASEKYTLFPKRSDLLLPHQDLTRNEVAVALYRLLKEKNGAQSDETSPEPNEESPSEKETDDTSGEALSSTLVSNTYVAGTKNAPVWTSIFRANSVRDITIRKMVFQSIGTALDGDTLQFHLKAAESGSNTLLVNTSDTLQGGTLTLLNGSSGIHIPSGAEVIISLQVNIASSLSADGATLQMELDMSELEIEDSIGNSVTISNSGISTGPVFTLTEVGSLGGAVSGSNTPDEAIVSGEEDVPVAIFEFEAQNESAHIEDITLKIVNADTTSELGIDIANDHNAIAEVALYDGSTGAPVLTKNGSAARTVSISSGSAFFEDLNLIADEDDDLLFMVAVQLKEVSDNTSARSGMAFALEIDTTGESTVRGVDSGNEISLATLSGNTKGNTMYVFANNVIAEKVDDSTNLVPASQDDLLRLTLTKANSSDAFLHAVEADVSISGGVTIDNVGLYNSSNELISYSKVPTSGNTYILTAGIEDSNGDGANDAGSAGANGLLFNTSSLAELPTSSGDLYDGIKNPSETYSIRADIALTGGDAQVVTSIDINGSFPGVDGIIWRDAGTDDGEDGVNIQWIDLGEADESTTKIEHVLSN